MLLVPLGHLIDHVHANVIIICNLAVFLPVILLLLARQNLAWALLVGSFSFDVHLMAFLSFSFKILTSSSNWSRDSACLMTTTAIFAFATVSFLMDKLVIGPRTQMEDYWHLVTFIVVCLCITVLSSAVSTYSLRSVQGHVQEIV